MSIGVVKLPNFGNKSDILSWESSMNNIFHPKIGSLRASRSTTISAEHLSKIWRIKPEVASKAIAQNSHLYRQGMDTELSKRFSTNDRMLRYKRIRSNFFTDTFFVTSKGISSRGNKCAQLFVSDLGFVAIYPMKFKCELSFALKQFCKDVGVPMNLFFSNKNVKRFYYQIGTKLRILEVSTQWANRAELYIGLFKESVQWDISELNSSLKLWDYCAERRAIIHNLTRRNLFQLNGYTPYVATFGQQGDMSNVCQFGWYEWCYYRQDCNMKFPFQKRRLMRVWGPLKNEGNEMAQAILKIDGMVIPRRSVTKLSVSKINNESKRIERVRFDETIYMMHGDSVTIRDNSSHTPQYEYKDLNSNEDNETFIHHIEFPVNANGHAIFNQLFYDILIKSKVKLPKILVEQ